MILCLIKGTHDLIDEIYVKNKDSRTELLSEEGTRYNESETADSTGDEDTYITCRC